MDESYGALLQFFDKHPHCAIAYSGGVDSTLLLKAALTSGADARAYYAQTAFQPAWERRDAERFAKELGMPLTVLELDVLTCPQIFENDALRCYYCKRAIFGRILERARADSYPVLLDGTNASDDADDRPGMRALAELAVLSPLRACGLDKAAIYRLSRELGLPSAGKPAYACLATRIPTGTAIDAAQLARVEQAEDLLFSEGFHDFRVRVRDGGALIQLRAEEQASFFERQERLIPLLKAWFPIVTVDSTPRKDG